MKDVHYWRRQSERMYKESANSFLYRKSMVELLGQEITLDAYCYTVVDPQTLCSVGAVTEQSVEAIHHRIMTLEYGEPDVYKYEEMIQGGQYFARLSDALLSSLYSPRYEQVLLPNGFTDEIRAALMVQGQCHGFLTLFKKRTKEEPYFQDAELEQVKMLMPLMGEALKKYYHDIIEERLSVNEKEQGIIIFNPNLAVMSINEKASRLLFILREQEQLTEPHLPKPIQAMCTRLLADKLQAFASVVVPIKDMGYIAIRASIMKTSSQERQLAVMLNEASPQEMLSFLMEAYHLTAREQEVIFEIIKGISTKEIAQRLTISYYTVQDHMKAIYHKVGVSTRNELVWRIFTRFQVRETRL